MFKACDKQLRVASGAYGLDYNAVIAMAQIYGVTPIALVELLPAIERVIVWAYQKESSSD